MKENERVYVCVSDCNLFFYFCLFSSLVMWKSVSKNQQQSHASIRKPQQQQRQSTMHKLALAILPTFKLQSMVCAVYHSTTFTYHKHCHWQAVLFSFYMLYNDFNKKSNNISAAAADVHISDLFRSFIYLLHYSFHFIHAIKPRQIKIL